MTYGPDIPQPDRTGKRPISLDYETHLIDKALLAPPIVCGTFCPEGQTAATIDLSKNALNYTETIIKSSAIILVGANTPYDLACVMAARPELTEAIFQAFEADRVEDVQTRQKLIDIARGQNGGYRSAIDGQWHPFGYSLADLTKRHLGVDKSDLKTGPDIWRLRYAELEDVPLEEWPKEAMDYALGDASDTMRVYEVQQKDEAYLKDSFRQTRAHFALHLMSCWGMATDPHAVEVYESRVAALLDEDRGKLLAAGLVVQRKAPTKAQKDKGIPGPWFSKKTKKAQARMEAAWPDCPRTKPTKTHPNGSPQLTEQNCEASGDDLLVSYQRFGSASTIMGNIYDLKKPPIQSRFNVLVETGRTSSTKPNIQNRSKKPGDRECFVPREGMVFMNADYDGLELRTLAQCCLVLLGHSRLAEVLNAGDCAHDMLAATIRGVDYETQHAERLAGEPEAKAVRGGPAKMGNFGFMGGMGPKGFAMNARGQGVDMGEAEAYQLRQHWLTTWPEMVDYFRWIKTQMREANVAWFEHIGSARIRGNMPYTVACNTPAQGLGSDATKAALWALTRACWVPGENEALYGCRLVNYIHDEFIMEGPDDAYAHDRAVEMAEVMKNASNVWLPDVPTTCEPLLMRRWSKNARSVYDAAGRLVPWDCDYTRLNAKGGFDEVLP